MRLERGRGSAASSASVWFCSAGTCPPHTSPSDSARRPSLFLSYTIVLRNQKKKIKNPNSAVPILLRDWISFCGSWPPGGCTRGLVPGAVAAGPRPGPPGAEPQLVPAAGRAGPSGPGAVHGARPGFLCVSRPPSASGAGAAPSVRHRSLVL